MQNQINPFGFGGQNPYVQIDSSQIQGYYKSNSPYPVYPVVSQGTMYLPPQPMHLQKVEEKISQDQNNSFLIQQQLGLFFQTQGLLAQQDNVYQPFVTTYINPNGPSRASPSRSPERSKKGGYSQKRQGRDHQERKRSRSPRNSRVHKKEGDWNCEFCHNLNFQYRDKCNRCQKEKQKTIKKTSKDYPKDWKCKECNNVNFARRLECNICKKNREEVEEL